MSPFRRARRSPRTHQEKTRRRRGFRPEPGRLEPRELLSGAADQPAVLTHLGGNTQKIYPFENGADGHPEEVNFWGGSQGKWAHQGAPSGTTPDAAALNGAALEFIARERVALEGVVLEMVDPSAPPVEGRRRDIRRGNAALDF
jgi:hypothetical protein